MLLPEMKKAKLWVTCVKRLLLFLEGLNLLSAVGEMSLCADVIFDVLFYVLPHTFIFDLLFLNSSLFQA